MRPFHKTLLAGIRKNKFRIYFVILLAFLIVTPLPLPFLVRHFMVWSVLFVFFWFPYLISFRKWTIGFGLCCVVLMIVNPNFEDRFGALDSIFDIAFLLLYFLIICYILWHTLHNDFHSEDIVFLGMSGFFLIGIGFAMIYEVLQKHRLVEFLVHGTAAKLGSEDLIYFSLTALSTIGFGDIVPITPMARRIAVIEGSLGTLYVAVLIGRLIGLSTDSFLRRRNPPGKPEKGNS
jgi:hypothetical protein